MTEFENTPRTTRAPDTAKEPTGKRWYVVQTKPGQEIRAWVAIAELGFDTFFPTIEKTIRHARKSERVKKPFYPRYVFAAFDAADPRWGKILHARGVSTILGIRTTVGIPKDLNAARRQNETLFGGARPLAVPVGAIEVVREYLTEVVARQKVADEPLKKDTKVRITDGPFAGWEALVDEDERTRVKVLLDILGKQTPTFVPRDLLTLPT